MVTSIKQATEAASHSMASLVSEMNSLRNTVETVEEKVYGFSLWRVHTFSTLITGLAAIVVFFILSGKEITFGVAILSGLCGNYFINDLPRLILFTHIVAIIAAFAMATFIFDNKGGLGSHSLQTVKGEGLSQSVHEMEKSARLLPFVSRPTQGNWACMVTLAGLLIIFIYLISYWRNNVLGTTMARFISPFYVRIQI